ncbi:MAG: hypothetical protein K0Q55_2069 [Verrucomicrobia bacterium]|jgi:hypothetical protein|nr:hypothetical protein [Verrucomicrobiota bacterium]
MEAYPIQIGLTERRDIILAQGDGEHEQVITLSPDQVEQVVAALRVAVETLGKSKRTS